MALTTSTPTMTVALYEGRTVAGFREGVVAACVASHDQSRHAERIFGAFDEALATAGWHRGQLDAVGL